jgi:pyruvate formate lyase activating enzyme
MKNGEIQGRILQMQNFSVNDGEGIRTTVFFAGCPLRCAWCANPEGWTARAGETVSVDRVLQKLAGQLSIFRFSGGGVTLSGGEPTAQAAFFNALTAELYDRGISLAVETCSQFSWEAVLPGLTRMDLIFADLKHMDPALHRTYTGAELGPILENLRRYRDLPAQVVVRVPTILTVNADEANIRATARFVRENLPEAKMELLPYHRYGAGKYTALGLDPPSAAFGTPDQRDLERLRQVIGEEGVTVVSYR